MNIESGRVIFIAQEKSGVSTRTGNTWKSLEFVIETNERMPRKIPFTIFGEDKIAAANLKLGETIDVVYYAEGHEFNGNWFSELKVTDICQQGFSRLVQSSINFGKTS